LENTSKNERTGVCGEGAIVVEARWAGMKKELAKRSPVVELCGDVFKNQRLHNDDGHDWVVRYKDGAAEKMALQERGCSPRSGKKL